MKPRLSLVVVALAFAAAAAGFAPNAQAADDVTPAQQTTTQVEIWASNTGWYDSTGFFAGLGNRNYAVGFVGAVGTGELRDWFLFDLSAVSGHVKAATLVAENPEPARAPLATYRLWDVETPSTTLLTPHYSGTDGQAIFADLGSGRSYGSVQVSDPAVDPVSVSLNSHGLKAIKRSQGGTVAVGGTYNSTGYLFGNTGGQAFNMVKLVLTVKP